ncbi:MAG: hypothetical protein RDV48_21315 [Candidatus Eremiobacteraeota bacterium]|nr:hypothetical protein [Candidatus Eremiobacteraeota bacterium]
MMAFHMCARCFFRGIYDRNPRSILGLVWRWHINFCPGWKYYMKSLPEGEKMEVIARYGLEKQKSEEH